MRLQLSVAIASLAIAASAWADGEVTTRGVYYKERSTRVVQPMLDAMFDVGARGLLDAHLLVDAITSASAGSGAATANAFTETRYEAGARYTHELAVPFADVLRLSVDGKGSTEPDYRSLYLGARGEAEFAQKNTVLGLGGGYSADRVDDSGLKNPMMPMPPPLQCAGDSHAQSSSCPLRTIFGSASASQIVSRQAVIAATYDVSSAHGMQSNAYRQVVTSGGFFLEKHPFDRLRQAIAVSARYYVDASETTFIAAYRLYHDDWKITAHTPELRIVQQVGSDADASFRYRYYRQTAAFFAASHYGGRYPDPTMASVPYYTDDPKMTAFDGHLMEAKLGMLGRTFGLSDNWARARFEGILEYIVQHNRFGNAVEAHVALTYPFDY